MDEKFFELHREMPRQGPGDDASTRQAFRLLPGLPPRPRVLDLGCGPGAQTLELARLCDGGITALDLHRPYLDELRSAAERHGLAERIRLVEGDMTAPDFPDGSFDLIWSEGAIYICGFEAGLLAWRPLLAPGGCVAVSEAVWLRDDPPDDLAAFWNEGYPAMRDADGNLELIVAAGYEPLGHFTLPQSAWWDAYYTPLEARLDTFEERWRDDPAALELLRGERDEIALYRAYGDWYGYAFYVMRRTD